MHFSIKGEKELNRKLRRFTDNLEDMHDIFEEIGREMSKWYATFPFRSSGQIYGQRWEALNPSYRKWKSKAYPGKPILIASGKMQDSFEYQPSTHQVRIFNKSDYFEKHQKGIGVPQRVIMKLDGQRQKMAFDIFKKKFVKNVRGR